MFRPSTGSEPNGLKVERFIKPAIKGFNLPAMAYYLPYPIWAKLTDFSSVVPLGRAKGSNPKALSDFFNTPSVSNKLMYYIRI